MRNCTWPGCSHIGTHPGAIPSRYRSGHLKIRRFFCTTHIVDHNRNYDFFEGMSTADIRSWQNNAQYGHYPTWRLGTRRAHTATHKIDLQSLLHDATDSAHRGQQYTANRHPRYISRGQRRALRWLGLTPLAKASEVRTRYKQLLKRFHPDTNHGNRLHEAQLQKTIKAYSYLKASGFC